MSVAQVPVAILAGGLATRLHPITHRIPKSLVSIANRPFLSYQLEYVRNQGIERVVLCVGHMGEQIRDVFGDGRALGVKIDYSFDGPRLLGTGGALKNALPMLPQHFFVLYGDSWLPVQFRAIYDAFVTSGNKALMTIFENQDAGDLSNVWFEDQRIRVYDKVNRVPQMRHIDYGLSVLDATVFDSVDERVLPFDLASVFTALARNGELAAYQVYERFYEIGSHAGREELDKLFSKWNTPATLFKEFQVRL